jgi:hypothetical protein
MAATVKENYENMYSKLSSQRKRHEIVIMVIAMQETVQ